MLLMEQPLNNVAISVPGADSSGAGGVHRLAQVEEEGVMIGVGAAERHCRAQQWIKDSCKGSKEVEEDLGNLKAAIQLDML